jgi:hypothetical protein
MTTPEISVPDSIRPYLNEIAERLWSGRAAVMVGAGFSKNAWAGFPDWNQLGDLFYEKAYGVKPNAQAQKYQNVLRLAEEVQAAIGRPALESLLRSSIPDLNVEPSELHVTLLGLPWVDVFTTNYDTLLERASAEVVNRRYEPVVNKDDISYADRPRIIKLHGSFPSERPFIITEEDYRRYPYDFAPFVNTVRQAMLENTFCLIGFSGDDPNFLQWLGWIRDNLGKEKTQKIYLVGVFNLSSARLQLLAQRGVIVVDLSCIEDIGKDDHAKALKYFFDFVQSKKPDILNWPYNNEYFFPENNAAKLEEVKKVTEHWKKQRMDYPGWIVLPEENREILWFHTKDWTHFFPDLEASANELDTRYLTEMIWRLERCLLPVFENIAGHCEIILKKYWPFKGISPYSDCNIFQESHEYLNLRWNEIQSDWIFIALSILRSYREDGHIEKWKNLYSIIQNLKEHLSPDQCEYLKYESYLFNLFTLDIAGARNKLSDWNPNSSLPFWAAKRAAMLAEMGDLNEADSILKSTLENVRKKLNQSSDSLDLSLISVESYLMRISNSVRDAVNSRKGVWTSDNIEREKFNERWSELKAYKCDPWGETKAFSLLIRDIPSEQKEINSHRGFDIGSIIRQFTLGIDNTERLVAYSFLRFSEEVGLPYKIGNINITINTAKASSTKISDVSSFWATATLIRLGDKKLADITFDRQSIHKYSVMEADEIVTNYLKALINCRDEINQKSRIENISFGRRLANILPELISRICCKCSLAVKYKILEFIAFTYSSPRRENYEGIQNLTRRLIQSMSSQEQYLLIPKLLDIPFPEKLNAITECEYLNPISFVSIDKRPNSSDTLTINKDLISDVLKKAESNNPACRKWALYSLTKLYNLGLFESELNKNFAKAIWSQTDEFGLPENTNFYKFAFLKMPFPDKIDPVSKFKNYIKNQEFPIQKDKGVRMTNGNIPVLGEILDANSQGKDVWSKDEISELLLRLLAWWDADKEMLKGEEEIDSPFGSNLDEFRARFGKSLKVISEVACPKLATDSPREIKDALCRLLRETNDYGLPNLEAEVACLHILSERTEYVLKRLNDALISNQQQVRIDALNAISKILFNEIDDTAINLKENAQKLLAQYINWSPVKYARSALEISVLVLRKSPNQFSENIKESGLRRLNQLLVDTAYVGGHQELSFDEKLEIRKYSSILAAELYIYFEARKEAIPEVLVKWKESCTAPDEFAEIRIPWLDKSII